METLNKVGLDVLEHKRELSNPDYSETIRRALQTAVTNLLSGDIITVDIHDALRNEEMTVDDVRALLNENKELRKSDEELKEEYDKLLQPFFEELLDDNNLDGEQYSRLYAESYVDDEKIKIIQAFEMSEADIGEFFNASDKTLDSMVRPDGFAEKFAIARYGAILRNLLETYDDYDARKKRVLLDDGVEVGITKVYVNRDEGIYGIEKVYHVPIQLLESDNNLEEIQSHIGDLIKEANEYVSIRMVA